MRLAAVVALSMVAGLGSAQVAAQGGVDGKWEATFDTPMGTMNAGITFATDGENLSGTLDSQLGPTPIKGSVKGNALSFAMHIATPQGDISVRLNAEVEGDAIKGTFDSDMGGGTWTGKRVK